MQHILISRTDAIGDVVLTLPVCGLIKKHIPSAKISFLGNSYTKEVISACKYVDNFINYNDWTENDEQAILQLKKLNIDTIIHVFPKHKIAYIAQKAGIATRIGTTNRVYHWLYCNSLIKLSRKNSDLHEAQLNIKLLKGVGIDITPKLNDIPQYYGLSNLAPLNEEFENLLSKEKFNLIIHPKSSGSAKEWSLERYSQLIKSLDLTKFKIFISGSAKEKDVLTNWIKEHEGLVENITGRFTLSQLLTFISKADGLVAASTGPVHLAAAVGINALGLYPNSSSINAKRWAPIGSKASYIQAENGNINNIKPELVLKVISSWKK